MTIQHLEDIGLVNNRKLALKFDNTEHEHPYRYFDKKFTLRNPTAGMKWKDKFGVGFFDTLTYIGRQLFPIAGAKPNYEYFDCLIESLKEDGFDVKVINQL